MNRAQTPTPGQTERHGPRQRGMSKSDFEEALSRAVAGEPLTDTGTVPFNVALQDVAASAPNSDARADAIEVARLVNRRTRRSTRGRLA